MKKTSILFISFLLCSCSEDFCPNGDFITDSNICTYISNIQVEQKHIEGIINFTIDRVAKKYPETKFGPNRISTENLILSRISNVDTYLIFIDQRVPCSEGLCLGTIKTFYEISAIEKNVSFYCVEIYITYGWDSSIENSFYQNGCLESSGLAHEILHLCENFIKGARWSKNNSSL